MNPGLVAAILGSIIRSLPADIVKKGLDALLDKIEDLCAKSENKWDDATVLPLIAALRVQLGIVEDKGSGFEDKQ